MANADHKQQGDEQIANNNLIMPANVNYIAQINPKNQAS